MDSTWVTLGLLGFLGYVVGSIPFGLILCRLGGHGDVRSFGSGNIGATNVLRTGSKKIAALTLLLDIGKGALAVALVSFYALVAGSLVTDANALPVISMEQGVFVAGLAAILGHMFPVWLKFKGGKGVATFLGVVLVSAPWVGLSVCGVWLAMAFLFRISSLAALVAVLSAPALALVLGASVYHVTLYSILALLVWVKHKDNIVRLMKGEESKIGKGKERSPASAANADTNDPHMPMESNVTS